MSRVIRFEIVIDSVATGELLDVIEQFESATCTVHRARARQSNGRLVTEDDFSDSISSNLVLIFVPKKDEKAFVKALQPVLSAYNAATYCSSCDAL